MIFSEWQKLKGNEEKKCKKIMTYFRFSILISKYLLGTKRGGERGGEKMIFCDTYRKYFGKKLEDYSHETNFLRPLYILDKILKYISQNCIELRA